MMNRDTCVADSPLLLRALKLNVSKSSLVFISTRYEVDDGEWLLCDGMRSGTRTHDLREGEILSVPAVTNWAVLRGSHSATC
ncbi:hypothetical protein RIF29_24627 [Crotalaria pallida]|uniref:Uncharacterized protein n=1 Tax=Crotalaria pallida TaxID=3830 RepID=A0AAN9EKT0_CROPI